MYPIFAPLQPEKSHLQTFSLLCTYVRTLYIGKSLKRFYLMFAAVFRLLVSKYLLLTCFVSLHPFIDTFQLSRLFLNKISCLDFDVFSLFM